MYWWQNIHQASQWLNYTQYFEFVDQIREIIGIHRNFMSIHVLNFRFVNSSDFFLPFREKIRQTKRSIYTNFPEAKIIQYCIIFSKQSCPIFRVYLLCKNGPWTPDSFIFVLSKVRYLVMYALWLPPTKM